MSAVQPVFLIHVTDSERLASLAKFLEETAYMTIHRTEKTLEVRPPESVSEGPARAELEMYLRVWERIHPGAEATIVD